MFSKYDYLIKKVNNDGIELKGFYAKVNKKRCILCQAGFCGGCDDVFSSIAEQCIENNISFLFGETTACHSVKEYLQILPDGNKQCVIKGGSYENFDKTEEDMLMWVNFALSEGYTQIYLLGHSLACNRIIKMLNTYSHDEYRKFIMLSPQDISAQVDNKMLEEAKININNGTPDKILTDKMFGFREVCSKTYYDMIMRKDINNTPYLTSNGNYDMLENINIPTYGIIGEKDQGLPSPILSADDAMRILKQHCPCFEYTIINNATHSFRNYEQEVAKCVINYLVNDNQKKH